MKKLAAIFLCIIFSFNWFGYRFMYDYVQHKNNRGLEKLFDNDLYDESQLVELKVALNLPYQTNRPVYERVDGEIEVEGILYKYVKRKVANDTLYVMCLPNIQKMHLERSKIDFFKMANDLQKDNLPSKHDNGWSLFQNLKNISDKSYFVVHILSPVTNNDRYWDIRDSGKLTGSFHLSLEKPPDC